jgi:hypothetical protein
MQEIAQFCYIAMASIKAAVALIKAPIVGATSLLRIAQGMSVAAANMHGGAYFDEEDSKKSAEAATKIVGAAVKDLEKAGQDVWDIPSNFIDGWNEIAKAFSSIATSSQKTKENVTTLATFKLPVDIRQLADDTKSLMKKFESEGISEDTISQLAEKLGGYTTVLSGQIKQVVKANDAIEAIIAEAARDYGVSAEIIRAVAWKESRYNPKAVGPVTRTGETAKGVMQLMPGTAKAMGVEDVFDPRQNIRGGAKYLAQLQKMYGGDIQKMLAAYNAGPGNVATEAWKGFAETTEYVRDLLGESDVITKKLGIDFEEITKQGPARFAEQAKEAKEDFQKLEMNLIKAMSAINEMMTQADAGQIELTSKQRDYWNNVYAGFGKALGRVRVYYGIIDAKQKNQTDKFNEAEADKRATAQSEYEKMMEDLAGKPVTYQDKYDYWVKDEQRKIEKSLVTNQVAKENAEKIWATFDIGKSNMATQMFQEISEKWEDFSTKVESHKVKTEFEDLNIEFEKLRNELNKAGGIFDDPRVRANANRILDAAQSERKALLEINKELETRAKWIDVAVKKNEYLAGSYSPIEQQQGELNALVAQHARDLLEVAKVQADVAAKWKNARGEWYTEEEKPGIRFIKEQQEAYEESIKYMQMIYEREFFRKQHPMWSSLVEQSKTWADGMTDALSKVTDGVDSMKEAFTELQKTILEDVKKAIIKNYITNPLMGGLEKIGKGTSPASEANAEAAKKASDALIDKVKSEAKNTAKLGKGGIDDLVKQGKPIPVYIVANPGEDAEKIAKEASDVAKDNADKIKEAVDETTSSVKDGTTAEMSWFDQLQQALLNLGTSIIALAGAGSASGGEGGGGGLFGMLGKIPGVGGLFDKAGGYLSQVPIIGGLFGGGTASSSMTGMGGAVANVSGLSGATGGATAAGVGDLGLMAEMGSVAFAFADGGKISEQIVGKGLESGKTYTFGEAGDELVAPMDKFSDIIATKGGGQKISLSMPIHISAIDTQSGAEFLMRNNGVIENSMIKMVKNNRRIRDAFRAG